MTDPFARAARFAALCCALASTAGAQAEGAAAASAPERASGARPAHLHIEDPACWPKYPDPPVPDKLFGSTAVRLSVDASGKLVGLKLEYSSGSTPAHFALDKSVAAAFAYCSIDPARDAEGRPVAGDTVVSWTWNLPGTATTPGRPTVGMRARLVDIKGCKPRYPLAALRAGATGETRLRFDVDASGQVMNTAVIQSAGPTREHRLLDEAIRSLWAGCGFRPALDEGGQPITSQSESSYTWRIE